MLFAAARLSEVPVRSLGRENGDRLANFVLAGHVPVDVATDHRCWPEMHRWGNFSCVLYRAELKWNGVQHVLTWPRWYERCPVREREFAIVEIRRTGSFVLVVEMGTSNRRGERQ